jgi:hypothetical protein
MLGSTLIGHQVVQVREPRQKRLLTATWMVVTVDGRIAPSTSASEPRVRAFHARGSSAICLLSSAPFRLHTTSWACDLTVHASPLRDIAPSRQGAGSRAYAALLRPITYPSPSARQPLRGITPGLCFLRDPSRHAMRWAPAHHDA